MFGNYLRRNDELSAAKFYLERALEMREAQVGQNHPDSAIDVNDLGCILLNLGDYKTSQSYLERAFNLFNQKQDYPNAAATLDNLGQLFSVQGKYESAQEKYQRALEIREKTTHGIFLYCFQLMKKSFLFVHQYPILSL